VSEVVCIGLATLDTVYAVPRHPEADDRVVADELAVAGGGPAATAAVALARLGANVAFVGAVGDDDAGREIREGLAREGVDVEEFRVVPGARSPQSTILVTGEARAIVHHPGTAGLEPSPAAVERMHAAEWVHTDHAGYEHVPDGARLSVDGGNPVPGLDLARVALYAPTEQSIQVDPKAGGATLVVVTRGAHGCTAYTAGGETVDAPAAPLDGLVSTLGAGDVFHGALLAAFVQGRELRDALAFANRAAALSCRALDGRSAIPTLAEMEEMT
jgi:sugar/nucleoside kinase (ribokinase family)